jgi:hypothetical protein
MPLSKETQSSTPIAVSVQVSEVAIYETEMD